MGCSVWRRKGGKENEIVADRADNYLQVAVFGSYLLFASSDVKYKDDEISTLVVDCFSGRNRNFIFEIVEYD